MPAMKSFLLLAGCALAAFLVPRPFRGGEEKTRGDVEHGRYLVLHVAMCVQCHSPRDDEGRILESRLLSGAPMPIRPPPWSEDWATHAPRIDGLPGYTDEAATRLLTQGGIGRDGRRLRSPMPPFRMAPQDAADVIAFLRSGSASRP
jgi:mono/diheme cytochrome c family protein